MDPVNTKLKVGHWNEYLSRKQLIELQKRAYRTFYLRPSSIWNMIKRVRSFDEFKIKMKGALDVIGLSSIVRIFNFNLFKSKLFKSNNQAPIGNTGISFKSK